MKRSMIVVCLLLLSPGQVMACIEDHNPGAGWFDQQPSGWSDYGAGAHSLHRDRVQDVSLFAGGLGVTILVGVLFRAMCQASRRASAQDANIDPDVPLVLPMDAPAFDPSCERVELASEAFEWPDPLASDTYLKPISGHSYAIDSTMSLS
jgi:hypothetical protein